MIVYCSLYIFYESHLVVLSGNLKKCSFQSAIVCDICTQVETHLKRRELLLLNCGTKAN
jgi:hypothetical protein